MSIPDNQILYLFLALVWSIVCVVMWNKFFYRFSPHFTSPKRFYRYPFAYGIAAMLAAFLIEHAIAEFFTISVSTILQSILYAFLVVAVTEELVKFFLMKKFMDNPDVDQVIDGVKVGLWVGLGFAFAENTLYFFRFFSD